MGMLTDMHDRWPLSGNLFEGRPRVSGYGRVAAATSAMTALTRRRGNNNSKDMKAAATKQKHHIDIPW